MGGCVRTCRLSEHKYASLQRHRTATIPQRDVHTSWLLLVCNEVNTGPSMRPGRMHPKFFKFCTGSPPAPLIRHLTIVINPFGGG